MLSKSWRINHKYFLFPGAFLGEDFSRHIPTIESLKKQSNWLWLWLNECEALWSYLVFGTIKNKKWIFLMLSDIDKIFFLGFITLLNIDYSILNCSFVQSTTRPSSLGLDLTRQTIVSLVHLSVFTHLVDNLWLPSQLLFHLFDSSHNVSEPLLLLCLIDYFEVLRNTSKFSVCFSSSAPQNVHRTTDLSQCLIIIKG